MYQARKQVKTALIWIKCLDRQEAKNNTDTVMSSKHIQAIKETLKSQASKYTTNLADK